MTSSESECITCLVDHDVFNSSVQLTSVVMISLLAS